MNFNIPGFDTAKDRILWFSLSGGLIGFGIGELLGAAIGTGIALAIGTTAKTLYDTFEE